MTTMIGRLDGLLLRRTATGREWASTWLNVRGAAIEVIIFPNAWERLGRSVEGACRSNAIVRADGEIDDRDDVDRLILSSIQFETLGS